ncbi:hypothetical protein PQX77_014607 [Marasmius sp. AFHP31]|nr:hypothetical protein PQX77_014607 [Marasmius sp. AFHP31]
MSHNNNPSPTPEEQPVAPELPGNAETYWSYQPPAHSYHVHTNPFFPTYATITAEQFPSGSGGIMTIPELKDSSNWHQFLYKFKAYLETHGISKVLDETPPLANANGYKEWKLRNVKARGVFKARVNQSFDSLITDKIKDTIQAFETTFGQEDIAQLVNFYNKDGSDQELKNLGIDIPENLFVLIVLDKLPVHWEMLKQNWIQRKKEDLKVTALIVSLTNEWDQRKGAQDAAFAARITGLTVLTLLLLCPGHTRIINVNQKKNQNGQGQQAQRGKGKGKGKGGNKPQNPGKGKKQHALHLNSMAFNKELFTQKVQINMALIPEPMDILNQILRDWTPPASPLPIDLHAVDSDCDHSSMLPLVDMSDTDESQHDGLSSSNSSTDHSEYRIDSSQMTDLLENWPSHVWNSPPGNPWTPLPSNVTNQLTSSKESSPSPSHSTIAYLYLDPLALEFMLVSVIAGRQESATWRYHKEDTHT